jgi:hypothetical protein
MIQQLNELKSLLAKAKDFRELLGLQLQAGCSKESPAGTTSAVPPSTSLVPPRVFGRDTDRDHIINLLIKKPAAAEASSARYTLSRMEVRENPHWHSMSTMTIG